MEHTGAPLTACWHTYPPGARWRTASGTGPCHVGPWTRRPTAPARAIARAPWVPSTTIWLRTTAWTAPG